MPTKTPKAAPAAEVAPTTRRLVAMPLGELVEAARNPKTHDIPGITSAMTEFGYVEVITLDERTGRLVAGHGRVKSLAAAKAEGKPAPEGVDVRESDGEWLVGTLRGWSSKSDDQAEAYLIASNKLVERGGWDDGGLAEMLQDVADAGLLGVTGFDESELDDLAAALQEAAPDLGDDEFGRRHVHTDDDDDGREADDDPLARQQRVTPGINDRRDTYEASSQRVLVLSYSGDTYVWMVDQLAKLLAQFDVETNSDAVLRLIEQATGETAPGQGG